MNMATPPNVEQIMLAKHTVTRGMIISEEQVHNLFQE
jgi:hypothetical protein